MLSCDLDGDGLKDLVLLDGFNLSIFYQEPTRGFTRAPQQTYCLESRPSVVWTAMLGRKAESVLVMTSDGVTELCFTNRTGPPDIRQIIRQRTLIPEKAESTNAMQLSLSVKTGSGSAGQPAWNARGSATPAGWPLLLVPTADGLQVWQHHGEWRQAQVIPQAVQAELWPSLANPGYITSLGINLSVSDVNGDGREDVMVRQSGRGQTNTYRLYLQQTNGLLALEPAMTYADKVQPFSWLCWADLNHDGKVDLVRSVWLNEPSFIPGIPSGKVLVSTYLADEHGRIPAQPHQVFRKNDWMAPLPVLDLDGDGYLDLVLGYGRMDSREGVRKSITAKQVDYSLRFFFGRPGAGFPKEADCQRDVIIHLERPELLLSWSLPQNFERYVKLGGDFNGDGKADLLVREHSDDISVYFFVSREQGFSPQPDLRFRCPEPIEAWQVLDLNGDGVSDLIVSLQKTNSYRIFTSEK